MNNRKLLFVSIILMLLMITISSASAGELNTAEDLIINEELSIDNGDVIDLNDENDILTSSENDYETVSLENDNSLPNEDETLTGSVDSEVLTNTYYPTAFDDLKSKISSASSGDTIVLSGTYSFSSQITINKQLNFVGTNNAILDGRSANRLFVVDANGVTFNNITFRNGYVNKDDGGAIYTWNSGLTINNCSFVNNYAGYSTGAIFIRYGNNYNISNSYFERNSGEYGGAISVRDVTNDSGIIYNCTFSSNVARYNSGAIENGRVENCTFIKNRAENGFGAAIVSSGNKVIKDCIFINNTASSQGGAIHISSGVVTNCYFEGNSAPNGGSIHLAGNNIFISGCIFKDSSASKYGGAINALKISNIDIVDCNFTNCSSKESGGAIRLSVSEDSESCNNISIDNCNFFNISSNTGGAISFYRVLGSKILNCHVVNGTSNESGGAIHINKGNNINVSCCYLEDSSATKYGGAFNVLRTNNLNVLDCNFTNCSSKESGGAIRLSVSEDSESCNNISIDNCNFFNISSNTGGAISFYRVLGSKILNCHVVNGTSNESGGAIHINKGNNINVSCCYLEDSSATKYGGAIDVFSTNNLNVLDCNFTNCSSNSSGGAVFINKSCSNITLSSSNFNNNRATLGGAIYWEANFGNMDNCNFNENVAIDSGGAVYLTNNTKSVNITGCEFKVNSVSNDISQPNRGGGAATLFGNGVIFDACTFISNSANASYGGAIFLNSSASGTVPNDVIKYSVFQDNNALRGKAIYAQENTNILLNRFLLAPGEDKTKVVSGRDINDLEDLGNEFSESKVDSSINSTNLTYVFGDDIVVPVSSEYVSAINVTIFDIVNDIVYNKKVVANGEFIVPKLAVGKYLINFVSIVDENVINPSSFNSTLTITQAKSSVSASAVTSYYGKTFSIKPSYSNATSIKYTIKNSKGTQVKSGSINPGSSITGLSFVPGTYTLTLTAVVDGNYTSSSASSKITVNKATGNITASALTTYYNSGKTWSITLKDKTNNKVLASKKLTLKVYTGSKYKTYTVKTNSKGVATFKASTLAPGSHKVIVSYSNSNYTTKSLTKTLKINKMTLSYKVSKSTQKDGAGLHVWVKNKATGKLINKIKIKLLVYTGKKYKTITLVSAKYSNKGNGYTGYAVKGPVYSVGTHTVKIMAGDSYHTGSVKSSLVLKSTVKKYSKKTIIISKGKRTVK